MSQHSEAKSISKGCFLYQPTKPPPCPPRKRKKSTNSSQIAKPLNPASFYPKYEKETISSRQERFAAYEACWDCLESKIKRVEFDLNKRIFNELLNFVDNAYKQERKRFPISEIPTAALVTGVNLPDHHTVFTQLSKQLRECSTPFVVSVQSKDCSNLKNMLKMVFETLAEPTTEEVLWSSTEEDLLNTTTTRGRRKFKNYTFAELKHMYYAKLTDAGEESMESAEEDVTDGKPPLVFIIEDFERFPPSVLQDFILICSEHTRELPIVLLFGLATSVASVHRSLPHFVSSRLSLEKFQAQPSIVCLTQMIDKVLLNHSVPLKVGPKVFRYLFESFIFHDFSLNNFVKGLKFSTMDHFFANEHSGICMKSKEEMKTYFRNLSPAQAKNLTKIPSFYEFLEKKSEKNKEMLLSDHKLLTETAIKLIEELKECEIYFFPTVKCLHAATCSLPGQPLGSRFRSNASFDPRKHPLLRLQCDLLSTEYSGRSLDPFTFHMHTSKDRYRKQLRDTYEYCTVTNNISKEKVYKNAMLLLRLLSREELLAVTISCIEILQESGEKLEDDVSSLQVFLEKFDNLDNIIIEEPIEKEQKKPMPVFKNRHDFQEQMRKAVKEKRKESPFEARRNQVVDALEIIFKKNLASPLLMPFNELFYYNDLPIVKSRLNGAPRLGIQKALNSPSTYLRCECCVGGEENIMYTFPDISILYRLHLECGQLINLYDWLQAFLTVTDPALADSGKIKSAAKKKLEKQLQARFIQGVAELQFLGFIKSTRRKTDHVQRLTWGGGC